MDVDAYTLTHRAAWTRLDQLSKRRRLSGSETDELITLYRRSSQQLARIRTHDADPDLIAGLSSILTRARGRVLRAQGSIWSDIGRFFTHQLPAELYRTRVWWLSVTAVCLLVALGVGIAVDNSSAARKYFGVHNADEYTKRGGLFESYYSDHSHSSFAAQVWTNNALVAAIALFTGILIVPAAYSLWQNTENLGIAGGAMAHADRLDSFFGFILPHGMLEMTCIFVAGGVGLKLGWTLIDPGRETRAGALARQGRATGMVAVGLAIALFVSGLIEGFVTPSGFPAAVRIGIGLVAWVLFMTYALILGRSAAHELDAESSAPASLSEPTPRMVA